MSAGKEERGKVTSMFSLCGPVQGSLVGMQAVVIGLIAAAIVFVVETTFTFQLKTDNMILACITVLTVVLVGKVRVSPIWIAIIMGTAGAFLLH